MQQRYYDPIAGRFLSVDPVTTDAGNGALFNRYMYAANNPFTLVDPDGRCTGSRITNSDGTCKSTGGFTTGTDGMAQGMQRESAMAAAPPAQAAGAPSASPASPEAQQKLTSFLDRLINGECGKTVNCGMPPLFGPATKGAQWTLGAFKSEARWASQFEKRGWTSQQVTEAISRGKGFPAENLVNKGNGAMRYVHPETGKSVVVDTVTKEVIHVGGAGFKY